MRKWIFGLLLVVFLLAGCKQETLQTEPTLPPAMTEYTLRLVSTAGIPLQGGDVYIYRDPELSDMVAYGETDREGRAAFPLAEKADY